ncbi:MAG: hypothetical protein RL368_937 [Pseudomonadota bacterium]|jgi:NTP pyrophosphatase (non-canonical NTP hydrolase)
MPPDNIQTLQQYLAQFATQRDWEQFHSPKNLSMGLIGEAAEITEHFQWLTEQQSRELTPEQLHTVSHELADVFVYLLRLADVLGIDLMAATYEKMAINELRFPPKSKDT